MLHVGPLISFTFNLRFKKKTREHKNGEHFHTAKVTAAGALFSPLHFINLFKKMTLTKEKKKVWKDSHSSAWLRSESCIHIRHSGSRKKRKKKEEKNLQFTAAGRPPLLGLHVQHQSIHSGEILHSLHTRKQRNKHAQYTQNRHLKQALIEPWPRCSLSPFFFSLSCFPSFYPSPRVSPSICDMSQSYFHVLAPLILKANTGRYVLMIVSSGHLSSVKLLSSEEVNTPSELWLF